MTTQTTSPGVQDGSLAQIQSQPLAATRARWIDATILALVSAALLVLILVPRLSELDALVTPDEPLWIGRSANFYQALSSGHLNDTYQFVHPGVPVMWMGALGFAIHIPDLPDITGGQLDERGRDVQYVLTGAGYDMSDVLVQLRQVLIVASALVLVATFLCLSRIVPVPMALAAIAFVSLDPMHIGFTRLLHVDGLAANLVLLSVVAYSWHREKNSRTALVVSGVAAGLACLTRAACAVLGPILLLIAAFDLIVDWRANRTSLRPKTRAAILNLFIWGIVAGVVFVVFWPAMWVSPVDTIRSVWNGNLDLSSSDAELNILFNGKVGTSDPGLLYFPTVLLYRISPVTMIGLVVALIAALRPTGFGRALPRRLCAHLLLFGGAYLAVISLSSKKLDRYILPTVVALDLLAALGLVSAAIWISRLARPRWPAIAQGVGVAVVIGMLAVQAGLASNSRPFYINEANPLLGGPEEAREEFSFNWGEGGKELAAAINQLDGYPEATVVAGPWPTTIDYYLPVELTRPTYSAGFKGKMQWLESDYLVVTYPQVQRQLYPAALLDWFDAHQPIKVVNDAEGVYARIYDIRNEPLPEIFLTNPWVTNYGDEALLVATDVQIQARQGSGMNVKFYFEGLAQSATIAVDAELVDHDGTVVTSTTIEQELAGTAHPVEVKGTFKIPNDLPLGYYKVRVSVRDAASGKLLPATRAVTGEERPQPIIAGSVEIIPN
jgi:hypothetical protein